MRYFFIFSILLAFTNIQAQDAPPEIFGQWYLYEVIVDETIYLPENYDQFPDIFITDPSSEFSFEITTDDSVGCSIQTSFPPETPMSFELGPNYACLALPHCFDQPDGPCTIMYGAHADFYFDYFDQSFGFTITENPDDTKSLQVTNANGDVAIYNSAPLMDVSKFENSSVSIYPIPAQNIIHIESSTAQVERIVVYSLTGQIVANTEENKEMDISGLLSGMYLVEVVSEGQRTVKKFIKK
ncbi:T9SS type A sorting domain-containing protein [Luteirhabdus pelagi]|uniref:T9SS type A sorting domain-containing protein n=1 Tax=Luteirhabdus pelagi TaxID=2792783 RepID=UPI001939A2FE|nr:T9SS type A sorting domain-containing protein [Luteirhabdus pelagi]